MIYDVLILGSGPAGFEVARLLGAAGVRTVIVSSTPIGGRATVGSLLPSKGWLHFTHRLDGARPVPDGEVRNAAAAIRSTVGERVSWAQDTLQELGVEVIVGEGTLVGDHTVQVALGLEPDENSERQTIEAKRIVIATGSEPIFFSGVKPDAKRLIAPRHAKTLGELPRRLVMIGGGVTGVEYAHAFARMGTEVTIVSYDPLLPRSDREYVGRLRNYLESQGISIHTGVAVESAVNNGGDVTVTTREGRMFTADYAFIATGRAGDLTFLGEGAPDLKNDGRALEVDSFGRTSVEGIFACGDVTGAPLTANKAVLQARKVVAAITDSVWSHTQEYLIEAIYTNPQLAQVGPVLELADRTDLAIHRKGYAYSMLGLVHDTSGGEIKFWVDTDGLILGAAAFGEGAAEVLAPVQLAINAGMTMWSLSALPFAYPTFSEVVTS